MCLCPGAGLASWFCCGVPWGPCCRYYDDAQQKCVMCPTTGCPPGKNCNDSRCPPTWTSGSCGNCKASNYQCAWPNISDSCLNQTQPQVCSLTFPRLGCGTAINVTNRCNNSSVSVAIADCGPRVKDFCNLARCCPSPWTVCSVNRIIDLTPAAFTAVGGDLAYGLFPTCIDKTITKP